MQIRHQDDGDAVIEGVRFDLREARGAWVVCATWDDGALGPELSFQTRIDAQDWLDNDAAPWLRRVNDTASKMPIKEQKVTRDVNANRPRLRSS